MINCLNYEIFYAILIWKIILLMKFLLSMKQIFKYLSLLFLIIYEIIYSKRMIESNILKFIRKYSFKIMLFQLTILSDIAITSKNSCFKLWTSLKSNDFTKKLLILKNVSHSILSQNHLIYLHLLEKLNIIVLAIDYNYLCFLNFEKLIWY
jgi:hypothetical protein